MSPECLKGTFYDEKASAEFLPSLVLGPDRVLCPTGRRVLVRHHPVRVDRAHRGRPRRAPEDRQLRRGLHRLQPARARRLPAALPQDCILVCAGQRAISTFSFGRNDHNNVAYD